MSTYLSIASKKEAKVLMGALEKKNLVTEGGVSTTLLNLPGTGHVMSALGQRLHIEPASNGARGFEQNHYMILFLFQLLMHAVFHHSLSNFPNPLNFHDSSLCGR